MTMTTLKRMITLPVNSTALGHVPRKRYSVTPATGKHRKPEHSRRVVRPPPRTTAHHRAALSRPPMPICRRPYSVARCADVLAVASGGHDMNRCTLVDAFGHLNPVAEHGQARNPINRARVVNVNVNGERKSRGRLSVEGRTLFMCFYLCCV